ncbi:hypothetical protein FOA52_007959 [Chlamydomonas sp. UWO 241]|nr:hypothetical protein FOA52_007959 [Chlamydomonas sp. UWO 241]
MAPTTPTPVASTPAPVAPTPAPVAPATAPTPAPVVPTTAPTPAPVAPTHAPVAPTTAPTPAPVAPTPAPVAPATAPVASTPTPVAPATAPTPATVAPATAPTPAPVTPATAPTPAPAAPTPAPVAPATAPTPTPPRSCPTELQCRADLLCNNCMNQKSSLYEAVGVYPVCSSCSCTDIHLDVKSKCFNCLSQARPGNTDGSWCTKCSSLHTSPGPEGGADSADECFKCLPDLSSFCVKKKSCADPPTHDTTGAIYITNPTEIKACWKCMSYHKLYTWGTGVCSSTTWSDSRNNIPPTRPYGVSV